MSAPALIIGAGLAGLIAAHAWGRAKLVDARPKSSPPTHGALLRFRSDAVSRLTGIEFRRVLVRKGVVSGGEFVAPNISLANRYSVKCLGAPIGDRSIWNVEAVERWVAPPHFVESLESSVENRIAWSVDFDPKMAPRGTVWTGPLPALLAGLDKPVPAECARAAPIQVRRFRLAAGTDLHQTVYCPDLSMATYRASITGDLLIVEGRGAHPISIEELEFFGRLFCVDIEEELPAAPQRFGKIVPLPDALRKRLLFDVTHERGIYALGRFATWRNILLDDVVQDISVITRLLRSGEAHDYEWRRAAT